MKIISHYWGDQQLEKVSEKAMKENSINISKLYIGFKQIVNFKFELSKENRTYVKYSLRGNNLKYYVCLLNHSFVVSNGVMIALQDANWSDYEQKILNTQTLNLLN